MRTCENCKKVFEDDMNFCPYCGEKYHDYHEELKNAMDDLFEDDKKTEVKNESEEEPVPVMFGAEKLKEERENSILNKILLILIILLVIVVLAGGYLLAKSYLFPAKEPAVIEQPDEENQHPLPDKDEEENNAQQPQTPSEPESEEPVNLIDEDLEQEKVTVTAIKASFENDQVRLDITCESKTSGEIYLSDNAALNIGPIQLREGNNAFYFTLNVREDVVYKLTFKYEGGQDEINITYDMISKALQS